MISSILRTILEIITVMIHMILGLALLIAFLKILNIDKVIITTFIKVIQSKTNPNENNPNSIQATRIN